MKPLTAEYVEEMWGPRCDMYAEGCVCCDMWRAYDEIERLRSRLAEVIAERDSLRTMLLNERAEWMDEVLKRQASVNEHLATLVTEAQEELRQCQQDAIALQDRLAEAERDLRVAFGWGDPFDMTPEDASVWHRLQAKYAAMGGGE